MNKIIAVDDDINFLKSLSNLLTYKNFNLELEPNPTEAINKFESENFDCAMVDVMMPELNGLDLLEKFQMINPRIPIIMISGESHYEEVVLAIKKGAYDFIEKPLNAERLLVTLRNALERKEWHTERMRLLNSIDNSFQMVGESEAFNSLVRDISIISNTNARVLIEGASGTGKELVARALHFKGNRSGAPFIKLNCAAIPSELLESELFGHKRGSFTGASNDHNGKFIQAHTGTLFLDEIGDMDIKLQSKVLRALQEGEIERLGDSVSQKVDVRIIAATNKNLKKLIEEGKFRSDLYHRLNVVKIKLPTLKERKNDIPILSKYFLQRFAETYNKKVSDFSPSSLKILISNDWPGNIRELKNIIEKIVIFTETSIVNAKDVMKAMEMHPEPSTESIDSTEKSLREAREDFEREYILKELDKHEWKIIETANSLGIDRSALFKKMKKLEIRKHQ